MKTEVVIILKKALDELNVEIKEEEISKFLEIPPTSDMGDYAFPCFFLSSRIKKNPHEIAVEIREKLGNFSTELFEDIQTSGPYINFFINRKELAKNVVNQILTSKDKFGKTDIGKRKKVLIEFSSPNIAKPFGIGHLRSTIIGNSLANIYNAVGFKTIRMNYFGDWGTQFGKLIVGYKKYGKPERLRKDPIKHLLELYIRVNKNKKLGKESREWFRRLEQGDKQARVLWERFRRFSKKEFDEIYKILGVKFDVYSGESMYNQETILVADELNRKNILQESDGAMIVNLKKFNLGVSLIKKSDGSTLYATRDLASAISRYEKYKFEKMIYEVGNEQTFHFEQVFKILELMGYKWARNLKHVSHGFYLDKDGKKFATRKGKTIFMEDIIKKTKKLAAKKIKERFPKISKGELGRKSLKVAIAAIFYGDLKNNRTNNIVFNMKRFVSFEGDTGPYLLYSYARANSILKKIKKPKNKKIEMLSLEKQELDLVKKLSIFPDIVLNSYKNLNPSLIANYSYQLAQLFNEFYHACPVIGSKKEIFRLKLVASFKQVIKNSLNLLGIDVLEEI